ncbi:hypothetical protein DFQ27_003912 [Actinomortierella ambigua]|uniref:Nascent polypeptide-associated complex subunit alpha n=1 Tax=Actinomortierella ambigua TaxID=1343610 RepID=A0A9P6Q3A7_9FUNG|nr:hypothetical protein DFQ27_003912 [Actinomortierella ambigua]
MEGPEADRGHNVAFNLTQGGVPVRRAACLARSGSKADIHNKIEEIHSDEETAPQSGRALSRNEIKARKAFSKVGLKQVKGITRVTIRRSRQLQQPSTSDKTQAILAISQPDVFKSANTETYVVFGEAVADNFNMASQLQAAQDALRDAEAQGADVAAATEEEKAEEEDDEEVDETGVDAGDIELVTAQANVSRSKAVKALKNNNNDIVAAIMELTM